MPTPEQIRETLRRWLAASEHTEQSAAKAAGLGPTALRDILSGKSQNPTARVLIALARVLGGDPRELLDDERSGFAEEPRPYAAAGEDATARAAREIARDMAQPHFWSVEEDMPEIGLCKGDVAVVEHRAVDPRDGDLVLVQLADEYSNARRTFRLYFPPLLLGGRRMRPQDMRTNRTSFNILGPVVGVVRVRSEPPKALPAPD